MLFRSATKTAPAPIQPQRRRLSSHSASLTALSTASGVSAVTKPLGSKSGELSGSLAADCGADACDTDACDTDVCDTVAGRTGCHSNGLGRVPALPVALRVALNNGQSRCPLLKQKVAWCGKSRLSLSPLAEQRFSKLGYSTGGP